MTMRAAVLLLLVVGLAAAAATAADTCSLCGDTKIAPSLAKTLLFSGLETPNNYGSETYCHEVHMQLCMAKVDVVFPKAKLPLTQGLCLPKACTTQELNQWWGCVQKNTSQFVAGFEPEFLGICKALNHSIAECTAMFEKFNTTAVGLLSQSEATMHCGDHPAQWSDISAGAVVVILLFAVFGVVVLYGEVLRRRQERALAESQNDDDMFPSTRTVGRWEQLLIDVAIGTSLKELFGKSPKRTLNCLDSLRAISMMWIIYAHFILFNHDYRPVDDEHQALVILQTETSMSALMFGQCAVDTFFFLSGMLSTYVLLKKAEKGSRRFPVAQMVFLRYLRLTPLFAMMIAFYATILRYTGRGPNWFSFIAEQDLCHKSWWPNLLYINNFYPKNFHEQCLPWTWYLADDMQFFFLGLVALYLYLKNRSIGVMTTVAYVIVGIVCNAVIIKKNDLTYFAAGNQDDIYSKPYTRIGAYAIGMLTAFLFLHVLQSGKSVRLKGWQSFAILTFVIASIFVLIYSIHDMFEPKLTPKGNWTVNEYIGYTIATRIGLPLLLCILVVVCLSGHGGIVAEILSYDFWEPLGKLTYAAYLVHPMIIRFFVYQRTSTLDTRGPNIDIAMSGTGCVTLAYFLAMILYVLVEMPSAVLVGMLMKKGGAPQAKSRQEKQSLLPNGQGQINS